jgi:predicted ABC-type ATPase
MGAVAELVVVTGPPGAGKSTVARAVSGRFEPSALVAGDDVFAFLDRGRIPPWTPQAHRQNEVVLTAAAAAAGRFVDGGYTVVYDGVVGPWFLDAFGAATGLSYLHYLVLLPPETTCVERVGSRVGHGFTDLEATRHMYAQFAGARLADRHMVRGTSPPEEIASAVVDLLAAGSLALEVGSAGQRA